MSVSAYRFYRLDGAGKISNAEWVEATDDSDAIRQVRELKLRTASEIWQGNRRITRVESENGD
jgi:hypothetical protein